MKMEETTMTNNVYKSTPVTQRGRGPLGVSVFSFFRISNFLRVSGFGFRISPRAGMLAVLVMLTVSSGGCGSWSLKWPDGAQTRRDVYMNLMTPLQQAHFLQLESSDAPASLKMAYLQEIGVYQEWAEQPKEVQAAILHRQVVENMSPLQVQLAWGPPEEERDETDPADLAAGHTRILWDYKPRPLKEGGVRYERSICFFDARVLWVRNNP
jgi:hypothetical protein